EDLRSRLERGRDHPVDGKDHHDEDEEPKGVHTPPAGAPAAAPPPQRPQSRERRSRPRWAHSPPPRPTLWRSWKTLISAMIATITTAMAEPRPYSLILKAVT